MDKTKEIDTKIMQLINVQVIRRLICNTNKGPLELMIRKGETKYFLTLDSVPLSKDVNLELMDILFKAPIPEVKKGYVTLEPLTKKEIGKVLKPISPNLKVKDIKKITKK